MTTATLKAEVQARLNAIAYSTGTAQATEVLQLAVDSVGLGCDLTNIKAVLNSITSAITGATPDDDLTAINAASIALGITTKENTTLDFTVSADLASNLKVGEAVIFDRETNNIKPRRFLQNATQEVPIISTQNTMGVSYTVFMGDDDRFVVTFYAPYVNASTTLTTYVHIHDTYTNETVNKSFNWSGVSSYTIAQMVGTPTVNPLNNQQAFLIWSENEGTNSQMVYCFFELNTTDIALSTVNGRTSGVATQTSEAIPPTGTYTRYYTTSFCWLNDGNIMVLTGSGTATARFNHLNLSNYTNTNLGDHAVDIEVRTSNGAASLIQTVAGNLITVNATGRIELFEYAGGVVTHRATSTNALSGFSASYPVSFYQNPTDTTEIIAIANAGTLLRVSYCTIDETAWTVSNPVIDFDVNNIQQTATAFFSRNDKYVLLHAWAASSQPTVLFEIGTNGRLTNPLKSADSSGITDYMPVLNGLGKSFIASSVICGTGTGLSKSSFCTIANVKNVLSLDVVDVTHSIGHVSSISGTTVTIDTTKYGQLQKTTSAPQGSLVEQVLAVKTDVLFIPFSEFNAPQFALTAIQPSNTTQLVAVRNTPSAYRVKGANTRVSFDLSKKAKIQMGSVNGSPTDIGGLLVNDGVVYPNVFISQVNEYITNVYLSGNYGHNLSVTTTVATADVQISFEEE